MKKLLALSILLASFATYAAEPIYAPQTLTVPIVSAGQTSNDVSQVMFVGKQSNTAIQWTVTGCTNWTARLSASVDGSSYQTNYYVIGGAGAGATIVTNLNTAGFGYMRIDSVLATGTINATNAVKYGLKISVD